MIIETTVEGRLRKGGSVYEVQWPKGHSLRITCRIQCVERTEKISKRDNVYERTAV